MFHRTSAIFILFTTTLIAGPPSTQPADLSASFYASPKPHTIHITVTAARWQMMQPIQVPRFSHLVEGRWPQYDAPPSKTGAPPDFNDLFIPPKIPATDGERIAANAYGHQFAYVKARFDCDGRILDDVAVRFKGNSSYGGTANSLKRPMKIDFNRFNKDQSFAGQSSLNLGANAYDPSQLREMVSYQVYRLAGIPTPRTTHAQVFLTIEGQTNRQPIGLYNLVEEVDQKEFLKHHYASGKGNLFKPESTRGMPYLGPKWEPYVRIYRPKSDIESQHAQRLIEFLHFINHAQGDEFAKRIAEFINVDAVLRYMAASTLLVNLDSLYTTGHNFYLHLDEDSRFSFIPWDLNLSLGTFNAGMSPSDATRLNIHHPWSGPNKLPEKLLAVAKYKFDYEFHLRQFTQDFFNPDTLTPIIAHMRKNVAALHATCPEPPDTLARNWPHGPPRLPEDFITARIASVLAQLDDDAPGVIPNELTPGPASFSELKTQGRMGNPHVFALELLATHDANRDMRISASELRLAATALFTQFAADSKSITTDQLATGLDELLSSRLRKGRRYLEGDAKNLAGRGATTPPGLWVKTFLIHADANHDNQLTLAELHACCDRIICPTDRDENGKLDESEMVLLMDNLGFAAVQALNK